MAVQIVSCDLELPLLFCQPLCLLEASVSLELFIGPQRLSEDTLLVLSLVLVEEATLLSLAGLYLMC